MTLSMILLFVFAGPTCNKGKKLAVKPKSSTPVPDISEPKESVINDLKPCAYDTHCADSNKHDTFKSSSDSNKPDTSKAFSDSHKPDACKPSSDSNELVSGEEQTCCDSVQSSKEQSCSDSSKCGSCKELFFNDSSKVSSSKDQTDTDSCNTDSRKDQGSLPSTESVDSTERPIGETENQDSSKVLSSCKEGNSVQPGPAFTENSVSLDCQQDCSLDSRKSPPCTYDAETDSCKHLCKSRIDDPTNGSCCRHSVPYSDNLKDSESCQNMCSLKSTCKPCSLDSSTPISPPSERVNSSGSADSAGSITLFGGNKGITIEAAETGTSIETTSRYSIPELSAIVNENAMFPDVPMEHLKETDEKDFNSKEEMEDGLEDPVSPHKLLLSPNSEDCLTTDSGESSQSEIARVCKDIMDKGWNVADSENVKMAELYLMFGKGGEIRFEYDWCDLQANEIQERLLANLNNMLRRLANLATVEFTDFSKVSIAS